MLVFGVLAFLLTSCSSDDRKAPVSDLTCYPAEIHLNSAKARQAIVVEATYADGVTRDVTARVKPSLANPKIARISQGIITPLTNGATELRLKFAGRSLSVPLSVTNSSFLPPVSFQHDVMPVFTKAGCNAGACHGTSRGKDGFHLSLYGFDPDGDYFRLTREQIGRRINLAIPKESLIVQKGLGAVQHTGGVRFTTNSGLYKTFVTWLEAGAPKDSTNVSSLTGIEIFPKSAVLEGTNSSQRFIVRARYSDGSDRDVTPLAVFISNNDVSAKAGDDGVVTGLQRGEAFIQARFGEFNVGAQIIVIPKDLPYQWPSVAANNYIDEAVYAKLKRLRLTPSGICDETTFVRRAFLDIIGQLPKPEETEKFLADKEPKKREKLVDDLLARKEFAEFWVMKWAELLEIRSKENTVYPKAAVLYFEWLRNQMLAGAPLDRVVRDLLTATGSTLRDPAANYFQMEPDTQKLAENTAQIFMGMRIQCAQCHNHPFDRWTLNDYYGFSAFFAQVGHKQGDDPRETIVFDRKDGEAKHPVTGAVMRPKFLGGDTPEIRGQSRREVLAKWLTSKENPYFARNIANIVWGHFLGRGIIEAVDDVRISNPPSNPELLDALAAKLVDYKYDLKKLVRDICSSRTYQLDTKPNPTNATDERNFAKASIRRIRAEVLLDCISEVTETQDKFPGLPRGASAVEIPDGNSANYFLTTFGRASRTSVCSCEVKVDPNLSQALHLLNGDTIQNKIAQGGVVKGLLKKGQKPQEIIQDLYLRCFSRAPAPDELAKLEGFLKKDKPTAEKDKPAKAKPNDTNTKTSDELVLNDLFWSLLNAKEFVFNH
ncbi:MAG: cell surface protein [Verrucomicrobia bacterium]|nr:MAG: cell surface protein [Verrucomicrobiota bacterium]